jgi:hypothetical protein
MTFGYTVCGVIAFGFRGEGSESFMDEEGNVGSPNLKTREHRGTSSTVQT